MVLLIRVSSAMGLGPTGEASSLSVWCERGFQQFSTTCAVPVSAWSVQSWMSVFGKKTNFYPTEGWLLI